MKFTIIQMYIYYTELNVLKFLKNKYIYIYFFIYVLITIKLFLQPKITDIIFIYNLYYSIEY